MKVYGSYTTLLWKEIHDLFSSKTAILLTIIISLVSGYSFYSAASLYSTASVNALNNPVYATGFEPVPGVFIPFYGGLFLIFSLFLPFAVIPVISSERRNNTFTLLLQMPFGFGGILTAKAAACLLFLLFITALTLPAEMLWLTWGGHLAWHELLLLLSAYLLYGALVIAVSFFSSMLSANTAGASVIAVILIISSWLIDFGRDMNISLLLVSISDWTITASMKKFEEGIFSLRAVLYLLSLSASLFSLSYALMRFDLKSRWKLVAANTVLAFIVVSAASSANFAADISESRRNAFQPHIVDALKKLPDLEIDIYLDRTDSRFKDYERFFLKRLDLVRDDVKIKMISGEALKERYGQFVYKTGGKSDMTLSTSETEIFQVVLPPAVVSTEKQREEEFYKGYPLIITEGQQMWAIYIYFGAIPIFVMTAIILLRRKGI